VPGPVRHDRAFERCDFRKLLMAHNSLREVPVDTRAIEIDILGRGVAQVRSPKARSCERP
jgi:hypothetical protein